MITTFENTPDGLRFYGEISIHTGSIALTYGEDNPALSAEEAWKIDSDGTARESFAFPLTGEVGFYHDRDIDDSIELKIGSIVYDEGGGLNHEGEELVVVQLEPPNGVSIIRDKDEIRLNSWRTGTLGGRLALVGCWEGDLEDLNRAFIEGFQDSKLMQNENFATRSLAHLQAESAKGSIIYTPDQ
jgi:hypothetical protein